MSLLNRQNILISLTSGAVSVISYVLIKKALRTKNKKQHLENQEQNEIYENNELLAQYVTFNYCDAKNFLLFDLKNDSNVTNCFLFPKRIALLCRDHCPDIFFSGNVSVVLSIHFN